MSHGRVSVTIEPWLSAKVQNPHEPEPDLTVRSTWHEFIKSHWDVLAACDFFTIELLVGRKLIRRTVSFVTASLDRPKFSGISIMKRNASLFALRVYAWMSFCTPRP